MNFRDSINNLIRSDRPESPTELVFVFGSLVLLGLMVYAAQRQVQVPHFEAMLLALGTYKGVKVWKGKGVANVEPAKPQE